jgi:hypothetical protein
LIALTELLKLQKSGQFPYEPVRITEGYRASEQVLFFSFFFRSGHGGRSRIFIEFHAEEEEEYR